MNVAQMQINIDFCFINSIIVVNISLCFPGFNAIGCAKLNKNS